MLFYSMLNIYMAEVRSRRTISEEGIHQYVSACPMVRTDIWKGELLRGLQLICLLASVGH